MPNSWGSGFPDTWGPQPNYLGGVTPQRRRASYDSSPHSFDSMSAQNDAMSYWNQVHDAQQQQAAQDYWRQMHDAQVAQQQGAPAPGGGGAAGGSSGGGAPAGGPPMDQFTAAINHVNDQYNAQLSNLDKLTGSARGGVQNVGNETLKRLAALGKDAGAQNKSSNAAIKKQYGTAKNEQNAAFQTLLADLQRQGAQTQGLGSEEAARLAAIQGAAARQGSTSDRYSQLLSQSLNERTGLARQSTQNSLDDLTKALQTAQFAAQQRKADQLYQIEQERQQMMAAMAAASRGGGGGGRGGGRGGRGGKGSSSGLTFSQAKSALGGMKQVDPFSLGYNDLSGAFVSKDQNWLNDPHASSVGNWYLQQFNRGVSPEELHKHYLQYDTKLPFANAISNFLAAGGEARRTYNSKSAATKQKNAALTELIKAYS